MQKMFQVVEVSSKKRETYTLYMTEAEMSKFLNGKMEMNYGSKKYGLDPKYGITAWIIRDPAEYRDLERVWKLYA